MSDREMAQSASRSNVRVFDQGQAVFVGAVVFALVVSAALLWIVSDNAVLPLVYAGGLIVIAALAFAFRKTVDPASGADFASPDWSVTVAAIEQQGVAVAITDRANRMVCANATYTRWFGDDCAPPNLPLERGSLEALVRTAREAWRDGRAEMAGLERENGEPGWNASAERAGRGDDYLVWRFGKAIGGDQSAVLAEWLPGALGQMLSRAGIESALVVPDGSLRAVSPGFAERASGDRTATLAGQDFVSQLRTDDQDRIFFAHEGRKGASQRLVQVPLNDPAQRAGADATDAPSLMLLLEEGIGLGGTASEAPSGAAIPQLEALLGALPLGLAMTDRDGRFLFGNRAFLRAVGREEEGIPQYPSDLVVREDKGALADAVRRFGKGPARNGDMAVRLRSQPEDPVSIGLAGVRGLGEAAVLVSLVDSTEETRLKRQVAQATKMQAVGQLAGGVAHDFNNVLTAIIGYCDLMLLRHTPGDSDYDDIQQIRANSNRAASLTRQLLAFSRQQTLRPEVLQLPDVISEVTQLLKRLMGEKITFKVRHDRDLGPVRADPRQLEQVIVNLAVNARDAMQGGKGARGDGRSELIMSTRRVSASDVRKLKSEIIPAADYTVLIVQDTGGGIPPDTIGKIFEPFFTTKEQGKGTGLGLSTVYGIVKQSGGFIFADNIAGPDGRPVGAQFTIYLPVYDGAYTEPAKTEKPEPVSQWSGGGRILLVEDEDMVRAVADRALTREGYTVTCARDGEEGLAAVANGGEFDLILSDVVMPGMDGPAMARGIRKVRPDIPILFMSGYAEEQLRKDIDIENMHFIAKPFSVQAIGEKVGTVLAAR